MQNSNSDNSSLLNVIEKFGDYSLCLDGVYKVDSTSGTGSKPEKICGYLKVVALYRNIDNNEWGKVVEFDDLDGNRHSSLIPNATLISNIKDILSPLVSQGLAVDSQSDTTTYLKECQPTQRARIVHRLGWHDFGNGRQVFVLPNNQIIGSCSESAYFEGLFPASVLQQKGTLQEWQDNVSIPASSSSRSILAICVALASPLVSLTQRNNAGFHIRGNSSSGKSIAQAIGCSVIGSPDMKLTWRSTANGLEGIALVHNDLMLPLDEISQADPTTISSSIYDLMNGKQKIRATKTGSAQSVQEWHLLVLSSGEENLRDIALSQGRRTKAGEEIRLADIPADAGNGLGVNEFIPPNFGDIRSYATSIKDAVNKFYGTAFIEWLKVLVQQDFSKIRDVITQGINKFVNQVAPDSSSQVKRVAESFGLLAVAGEFATCEGITGWQKGVAEEGIKKCFRAWLDEFGDGRPKEDQQLIDNALEVLTLKHSCFIDKTESKVPKDWIGWIDNSNKGKQIFMVPLESYKKFFCMGKKCKYVDRVLMEADLLKKTGHTLNPQSKNGVSTRVRCLELPP